MEQLKRLAIILAFAVCTALLLGSIGFVVGFFGPMLIAALVGSEANLGPLWGIFILAPGGTILGFLVGAFVGYKKIRNK
jgi:predicted histidine transporter YuiF (NhaC family)